MTPKDIEYSYKPMFCDKIINVQSYNLETILAEKFETVISRGTINTRMRDFYVLHLLKVLRSDEIDFDILRNAFKNTAIRRESIHLLSFADEIINSVEASEELLIL